MSARAFAWGRAQLGEASGGATRAEREAYLSDVERGYLARFGAQRRCDEFIAGRLAARRALNALAGVDGAAISIERHEDGAPHLVGLAEGRALSISISHGKYRAIAIAAEGCAPLGVDLCDRDEAARVRRVARRCFPRVAERALVLAGDFSCCAGWALKEAVAKSLRMGLLDDSGFERIEVVSLAPPRVTVRGDDRAATLSLSIEDDGDAARAVAIGA